MSEEVGTGGLNQISRTFHGTVNMRKAAKLHSERKIYNPPSEPEYSPFTGGCRHAVRHGKHRSAQSSPEPASDSSSYCPDRSVTGGNTSLFTTDGSSRSLTYSTPLLGCGTLSSEPANPSGTAVLCWNCGSEETEFSR
jgi:hypothetical protein